MCVILFKPIGVDLIENDVYDCFDKNPDGAGFMYRYNGKIVIEKGFMTYYDFLNRLEKLDDVIRIKDLEMVLHFRIGTQGGNVKRNTHPFPLSKRTKDLRRLNITTSVGIAHNGIIPACSYNKKTKNLSDTQIFIKDYLNFMDFKKKSIREVIGDFTASKFVIMTPEQTYFIGDFKEINGCKYSNDLWKWTYDYYDEKYDAEDEYWENEYEKCAKCVEQNCEDCKIAYGCDVDELDDMTTVDEPFVTNASTDVKTYTKSNAVCVPSNADIKAKINKKNTKWTEKQKTDVLKAMSAFFGRNEPNTE